MVECDADLVVGQHSHCVGCEEEYLGGRIVYGQGNFIFDKYSSEFWKTGMILRVTFGEKIDIEYIPLCRENKGSGLGGKEIIDGFMRRSEEIKTPGFVAAEYEKYSLTMIDEYLAMLTDMSGESFSDERNAERAREENLQGKYHTSVLAAMENLFRCEAHNELIQAALHSITRSGKYHGGK